MSGFELLVRLSRRITEERQANLGQIRRASAEVEAAIAAHETSVAAEANHAEADLEGLQAFAGWARAAQRRRTDLERQHAGLAQAEAAAQLALQQSFKDLKAQELALDAARRAAAHPSLRRAERLQDDAEQIRRNATLGLQSP